MTRLPLVFHPGVEDDIAAIYDYYEQFDPALPSRFEAGLDEQVERVEMFTESGAFLFESYRRVLVKRFPYMAVYVVRDDHIDVLAVLGVRRAPARGLRLKVARHIDGVTHFGQSPSGLAAFARECMSDADETSCAWSGPC